jgi:hypothetical protein
LPPKLDAKLDAKLERSAVGSMIRVAAALIDAAADKMVLEDLALAPTVTDASY